jgi:filamentous hemagglutinin family protein
MRCPKAFVGAQGIAPLSPALEMSIVLDSGVIVRGWGNPTPTGCTNRQVRAYFGRCLMIDKSLTGQLTWLQQWLTTSLTIFICTPVYAQITPDNTLGSETSRIAPNTLINNASADLINGGAQRGSNLFHSFSQFNISDGQRVYFGNPSGVQNILTRVTGASASNILGTLGVDGFANLFLMNPNGILFGKNASLDVRGSFVATTANAIQFGNQGVFSATNPQSAPLLTINPSALQFTQVQANAGITNQSIAPAGVNLLGVDVTGLRVPDGKSLLLVGGDINIDGGSLRAYNGNIELAGLATPGVVQLNTVNNTFSLSVPSDIQRSNIFLTNGAEVNVRGSDAGSITINTQNLSLVEGSKLRAGIDTGLGTLQSKAGDITVNATESAILTDSSFLANVVQANSIGQGGNINVSTSSLTLTDSSNINGNTFGNGTGANIFIKADGIFLNSGSIFSSVQTGAVGNAGNLTIDTGLISLINGSEINSKTLGQGNAGNININAQDISIDGKNDEIFSRITTAVNPEGVGKSGNIQINTSLLKVTNGAFIDGSILGKGEGGNISINAKDIISLNGDTYISNIIGLGAEAITKGGDIQITTGSLSLTNGAVINTSVLGKGNAGNININARDIIQLDGVVNNAPGGIQSNLLTGVGKGGNIQITTGSLLLTNGAGVSSDTIGRGDGGNITISARDRVAIEGFGGSGVTSTAVGNETIQTVGNAGDIRITTGELLLKNGGSIKAFNGAQGKGGNITLDVANTTTFDGFNAFGLPSSADSFVGGSSNDAGNIQLKTGSLFLINGGQINTSIVGDGGNAGKITIVGRDRISIDGVASNVASVDGRFFDVSGLNSSLGSGEGRGGDIEITTGSFSLTNGAGLSTSTNGRGNAGNITINARDTVSFDGVGKRQFSNASSTVANAVGNGGDIRINAKALFLTNGAGINTFSFGQGNAGNIIIDTSERVTLDGAGNNNSPFSSTISAFADASGNGGEIQIKTGIFTATNGGNISTFARRNAGNIIINARDAVSFGGVANNGRLSGASSFLVAGGVGKGGNIEVTTPQLSVTNGSQLSSSTNGKGNGGDIVINAPDTVKFDGAGAFSTVESTAVGNAGNIKLNAGSLSLLNAGQLSATTVGQGNAGDIAINVRDTVKIDGVSSNGSSGIFSAVGTTGKGNAGNIKLTAGSLSFTNGGLLNVTTFGQGNAGDIVINTRDAVDIDGVGSNGNSSGIFSSVGTEGIGKGGNIEVQSQRLSVSSASISSSGVGVGNAGDININSRSVKLDRGLIGATTNSTDGGNINIKAADFLLLRRGSAISTTAGFAQAGGNGGNITIDTPFIVAVPKEDSDITANAFTGNGGKVNINVQSIFGIKPLAQASPNSSDITASSQFGLQGQISITQPEVQPLQAILELPGEIVDATTQLSQLCPRGAEAFRRPLSKFIVTGRGSLPPSPLKPLPGKPSFRPLATLEASPTSSTSPTSSIPTPSSPLIEAQGFMKNANGEILLVAQGSEATPSAATTTPTCPTSSPKMRT